VDFEKMELDLGATLQLIAFFSFSVFDGEMAYLAIQYEIQ